MMSAFATHPPSLDVQDAGKADLLELWTRHLGYLLMTKRNGFHAGDAREAEGSIDRLRETLGKALALADRADVDLVAIHIANAIHAAERYVYMKALRGAESDVAGTITALASKRFH